MARNDAGFWDTSKDIVEALDKICASKDVQVVGAIVNDSSKMPVATDVKLLEFLSGRTAKPADDSDCNPFLAIGNWEALDEDIVCFQLDSKGATVELACLVHMPTTCS